MTLSETIWMLAATPFALVSSLLFLRSGSRFFHGKNWTDFGLTCADLIYSGIFAYIAARVAGV